MGKLCNGGELLLRKYMKYKILDFIYTFLAKFGVFKCLYCEVWEFSHNLEYKTPHFESGCCGRGMCESCYISLQGTDEQLQLDGWDYEDEEEYQRVEKQANGCGYLCFNHMK